MVEKVSLYSSNLCALVIYQFLSLLRNLTKTTSSHVQYLFVNFGQIGDLSLTSVINDYKLSSRQNHILVDERYLEFAKKIFGEFDVKAVNLSKYKKSLKYRIKFLLELRQTKYQNMINLTSSRRILTDEICLLVNAQNYVCLENTWKIRKPLFRNYFDKKYSHIHYSGLFNEYDRIINLFNNVFHLNHKYLVNNSTPKLKTFNPEKYIVIAPFSSNESHSWELRNYLELINLLSVNYNIYVIGYTSQSTLNMIGRKNVIDKINKTSVVEAVDIISHAIFFVGNDSGLTHIALKFKIPLLGILGGGNFGRYLPFNESGLTQFVYHKMDCFNCEWYCKYKEPLCLNNITVEEVFSKCEEILTLISKQKEII